MAENRISEETRARIRDAWPDILADIASGSEVRKALARAGVTETMKRAYLASEPGARAEWDDAREASADSFCDEAIELTHSPMVGMVDQDGNVVCDKRTGQPLIVSLDSGHVRARLDALKWLTRIRNPRVYGDKAQLDVNVRTVDLTRIITEANARLEASRMLGRTIEGAAVRVGADLVLEEML